MRGSGIGKAALTLGALAGLAGCYEISSAVPAITDASRLAGPPLEPGRYCGVDVVLDDAGAIDQLDFEDCLVVTVSEGALVTRSEDPTETEALSFEVAELTRGARLLQGVDPDAGYLFTVAMMRADAVAVLDEPIVTPAITNAAAMAGVSIQNPEETSGEISILSGEPGAVLGFLREAAGLMFDDALRDEAVARDLREDALYYVRVGTTAGDSDMSPEAAREKILALEQMIERAMALE
jgi:hypothetical protein